MAFDYTNLYPDTSANGGYTKSWNYTTVTDSIATCAASGYFNKVATRLGIGDNIVVARVDAFESRTRTTLVEYADLFVSGISGGVVTTIASTTGYATTSYVDAADAATAATAAAATALKANIASPTFTGVPAAPTASPGTNTTQLATTAFTVAEILARVASLDVAVFKGVIDCSANPNYPAADAGWTYRVSVAGKIGGASGTNVEAGDMMMCITDGSASGTQAAVGANWDIIQANIDGAVVGPASAVSGRVATFSGTSGKLIQDGGIAISAGQYPAEPTTGSATAGNIGELITSTVARATNTSLTSATPKDITTISLTAGDWEVSGSAGFAHGTSATILQAGVSTTTATLPTFDSGARVQLIASFAAGDDLLSVPASRLSLNATTTVFLVMQATFTGTTTIYGTLRARRVR
ncbi:hypothetical protein [Bradyrhizobium sp. 62]|uniref:hypothetical protein n=1 Tax=Bradyrhizobium sp. 62 TaxID=1043588 RepID=UPI001FF707DA|nr:hypothetical protein [Bradyrhizobium sp. 62]MCK1367626.1 hypothetical protein [Bradyrhizobium sp. 62]